MNCLIETLSLMNRLPETPWLYREAEPTMFPEGQRERRFSGRQTNEAPTKYFLWLLAARGELIDRILLLVSRECMERSEALGGRSTYEFFREAITAYMEELAAEEPRLRRALDEGWGGSAAAYLDAVLTPVSVPERMDPAEWRDIVNTLFSVGGEPIDLYVDFTGGSRVASLISLLLLRILKSENANVRQVIYADIQDRLDPKLVDCTESYGILTAIENIAGAGENRNAEIMKVFVQYRLADPAAVERSRSMDEELKREKNDLRVRSEQAQERNAPAANPAASAKSALQQRAQQREEAERQTVKAKSPFQKLIEEKEAPDKLISRFYEEIYFVFHEYHVYGSNFKKGKDAKEEISNLLRAHDKYYSCTRKYGGKPYEFGVIPQTKRWLKKLHEMPQNCPLATFEEGLHIDVPEYSSWIRKERYVNGVSAKYSADFEKYLQDNGFDTSAIGFRTFSDWERVYYNYTFPFMCVNKGSVQPCPEIMNYYLDCVRALMERLEALYDSDRQAYQRELDRLLQIEGALEAEIPYKVEFKTLWLNRKGFASTEAANTFTRTLCKRLERARPYRNAIAHHLTNDYSKPEKQKDMAEEIRGWLREYETEFPAPWKL